MISYYEKALWECYYAIPAAVLEDRSMDQRLKRHLTIAEYSRLPETASGFQQWEIRSSCGAEEACHGMGGSFFKLHCC